MESGVVWAILAALSSALLFVFEKQASNKIDNILGSIIISLSGVIIGVGILVLRHPNAPLIQNTESLIFLMLAGICALAIDYFTLKTYSSGLPISIGGTIIIGGSIALTTILGFFLGESTTYIKIIGILLVLGGASLLVI